VLYSVYAVLGVNSRLWHAEIEKDDLTLCSVMIVELWIRKRDMGDEDANDGQGYEQISEIRCMTCLFRLGTPLIGVITCRIGTHTCPIRDGKLTGTLNSLKSQFLMMISPMPSTLSLFVWFSTQPSPNKAKLSYRFQSLHDMICVSNGSKFPVWFRVGVGSELQPLQPVLPCQKTELHRTCGYLRCFTFSHSQNLGSNLVFEL
jgi:hypothetical protein